MVFHLLLLNGGVGVSFPAEIYLEYVLIQFSKRFYHAFKSNRVNVYMQQTVNKRHTYTAKIVFSTFHKNLSHLRPFLKILLSWRRHFLFFHGICEINTLIILCLKLIRDLSFDCLVCAILSNCFILFYFVISIRFWMWLTVSSQYSSEKQNMPAINRKWKKQN